MRSDPAHDFRGTHGARLTRDLAPVPEQRQRRDALDAELGGDSLFVLGVELGKPDTGFQLCGCLLERRGHYFARAAPGCPEINHNGDVAATDMLLEGVAIQFQGMGCKEPVMALATTGIISQPGSGDTVNGIAMRADNMLYVRHGRSPVEIDNSCSYGGVGL